MSGTVADVFLVFIAINFFAGIQCDLAQTKNCLSGICPAQGFQSINTRNTHVKQLPLGHCYIPSMGATKVNTYIFFKILFSGKSCCFREQFEELSWDAVY